MTTPPPPPSKRDTENALDVVTSTLDAYTSKLTGTIDAHHKAMKEGWDADKKRLDAEIQKHAAEIESLRKSEATLKQALVDFELDGGRAKHGDRKAAAERAAARRVGAQVMRSVEMAEYFRKGGVATANARAAVSIKNLWGQDVRAGNARDLYEAILKAAEAEAKGSDGKIDFKSIDFDESNAGSAVIPMFRDGVVENPISIPIIRQLATVMPTTETNVIKGDREVRRLNLVCLVSSTTASGNTVFPVDRTEGFSDDPDYATVYLDNGTTLEKRTIASGGVGATSLTLTAVSSINMPAGSKIFALRSAAIPEGASAGRAAEILEKYSVPISNFASSIKVQLQKLSDIPWSERFIETRLLSRLAQDVDYAAFYGDGTGDNPLGFFKDPAIPTLQRMSSETYIDFIVRANYEVMQRHFMPGACPVSYDVHRSICLTKGTDGHYIAWRDTQTGSPPQIHVTRLVYAPEFAPLSGGVGDWALGATVYDREEGEVSVGTENDDFTKQKRTMLATERAGIGYDQPLALETLNFAAA